MSNQTAWIIAFICILLTCVNSWFMGRCWRKIQNNRYMIREQKRQTIEANRFENVNE